MENRFCLLGFSGNILSLIFNTLNSLEYSREVLILENMKLDDDVPFACNIPYQKLWFEDYRRETGDVFAFSLMRPSFKEIVYDLFNKQFQISMPDYRNILHPSLSQAANCVMDLGIYVEPGCVISPYAEIGFGVSINRGCTIGHHTVLQKFSTINPGVHIAGHCNIGIGASVGIGTTIFDHVTVGNHSIIGGGSVVTRDIPEGVLAYGNPCKIIKQLS